MRFSSAVGGFLFDRAVFTKHCAVLQHDDKCALSDTPRPRQGTTIRNRTVLAKKPDGTAQATTKALRDTWL
jgi:hypothetical protein